MSRETSFGDPITELEPKCEQVRQLAMAVADRTHDENALYQTIGIKVVTTPFDVHTRAHSLGGPVDDPQLLEDIALELLEEFAEAPVRKLGVRVANLSFSDRQQVTLTRWETADGTAPGELATAAEREQREHTSASQPAGSSPHQLTLAAFVESEPCGQGRAEEEIER